MSDDDPEPFTIPLPPPPAGMAGERDVFFYRRRGGGAPPEEGERESEDIMLRNVPRAVAQRYRAAAGGRGMTHAQYLAALVALHESMRNRADAGDAELQAELERLGLTTVSV
ncbi:MAG TPA: hypothetical protein VLN26_07875 [Gaiellaceae bacterium]|nr:hypothetical protein [Gaiellaceae bacterium]